jgi:integrase
MFPGGLTPLEMRHTFASLSISAGANVKALQKAMGHAKASGTLDTYSDFFEEDLRDVGVQLERIAGAEMSQSARHEEQKSHKAA